MSSTMKNETTPEEGKIEEETKQQEEVKQVENEKKENENKNIPEKEAPQSEFVNKVAKFIIKSFLLGSSLYFAKKFLHKGAVKSGFLLRPKFWLTSLNLIAFLLGGDLSHYFMEKVEFFRNLKQDLPFIYSALNGPVHLFFMLLLSIPLFIIKSPPNNAGYVGSFISDLRVNFFQYLVRGFFDSIFLTYKSNNLLTHNALADLIIHQEISADSAFISCICSYPFQKIFCGETFDLSRVRAIDTAETMRIMIICSTILSKFI